MANPSFLTRSPKCPFLCADELQQQTNDFLWLLLLHPVSRTVNHIGAAPLGAGAGFHSLKRTGGLIDAPIALARNETGRYIDCTARKRFKLGSVFAAAKSGSIPL